MTMLYLYRHGIAEELRGRMPDEDRRLTAEGKEKVRAGAEGFRRFVGKKGVVKVLTSPLVRAVQTAEIVAEVLSVGEVEILEAIAPPGDLKGVLKEVRRAGSVERGVVVVGHEPVLGEWAGEICFGKRGIVEVKKGGVVAVKMTEGGRGVLCGVWEPRLLRALGK